MPILSSTHSIARYTVKGKLEDPVMEMIETGLKKNTFKDIDNEPADMSTGWTSLNSPYNPDFDGSSFIIGPYVVFSMRIDKKSIPAKVIQKHCAIEEIKRLKETDREFLSRTEKKQLKDHVIDVLTLRIPSTPSVHDLIWNYEESSLWFFSTQKAANEELETLFSKSFDLTLVRLFPYTMADFNAGLSDSEKDILNKITPTHFTE